MPPRNLISVCASSIGFLLVLTFVALSAEAQNPTQPVTTKKADAAKQKVEDAAQQGFPLSNVSIADVTDNVSVEATVIPASIAKTVFGKEVSNNYAVIALTISNRSPDYAFIVHTIFIDYSQWLLGGSSPYRHNNTLCVQKPQPAANKIANSQSGRGALNPQPDAVSSETSATNAQSSSSQSSASEGGSSSKQDAAAVGNAQDCPLGNRLQTWQQQTLPNQINSVETRIVRGQLLARQPWTTRNWVLRALQSAGSIATGFTFVTSSQSWIRGIGAFNGSAIPAAQNLWPDAMIGQMNEISDVGFQVNKVIAKQSSDIIVAFFPIDRFLTPSLKAVFISSPAAFFSPIEALMDKKSQNDIEPYLEQVFGKEKWNAALTNLFAYLPQVGSGDCNSIQPTGASLPVAVSAGGVEGACLTADIVNRLSLNTVRVLVGGTMTVDVKNVPPQITSVEIEPPAGKTATDMWPNQGGTSLNGIIRGSFLSGATPTLVNPDSGVTIKKADEGSTDQELHFTLTLASPLTENTKQLTFQVTKTSSAGSTIKSATYNYQIERSAQANSPQGANNGNPAHSATPPGSGSSERPPAKK